MSSLELRPDVAVIAWLKMLENQSAQQRPEDPMGAYDFTWLWRELGVGDERR